MRFVILPDHPAAGGGAVARLEADGARQLRHASGRPWIIGWWADQEAVTGTAGDRRIALLGSTTADRATLERRLSGIRSDAGLASLAGEFPGCFHLISSFAGQVRAQGSVAGAHRIFYGTVNGVTVAADRPDWLVDWTGASLDEDLLPLCLLRYGPPWPLNVRCLWRGIEAVRPGDYLNLDHAGRGKTARWWSPPAPEFSRTDGAARVHAALTEAVRARAASSGSAGLSIDLSGGLDSTSLCYLADRLQMPFTTIHYVVSDSSNPDGFWAERARNDLAGAQHVVCEATALPGLFADEAASASEVGLEGPTTLVYRGVAAHLAGLSAAAGAGQHLQGYGADELFAPGPAVLPAMVRRHPWQRLRRAREMQAKQRVGFATAMRGLRDPGSYRRWLLRAARNLDPGRRPRLDAGWEPLPRLPEWATPEAADQVASLVRSMAEDGPEPLAPDPAGHQLLRGLQAGAQMIRQSSVVGEPAGVRFEGPYLDDRTITAVMSVRWEERFPDQVNKAVLATAMHDVTPPDLLQRTDKSHGSRDLYDGLRRSRPRLAEALADPLLARLGLVAADRLRSAALGLHADLAQVAHLNATWASEMWLQAVTQRRQLCTRSLQT